MFSAKFLVKNQGQQAKSSGQLILRSLLESSVGFALATQGQLRASQVHPSLPRLGIGVLHRPGHLWDSARHAQ